jgi:hypothetical protein
LIRSLRASASAPDRPYGDIDEDGGNEDCGNNRTKNDEERAPPVFDPAAISGQRWNRSLLVGQENGGAWLSVLPAHQ